MQRCPYVWRGFRQAGFRGGWLDRLKAPECPPAVEGRWREPGTPFHKVAAHGRPRRPARHHATATMRAARIHSYGDPTAVKVERAPRPEPGERQVLVRVQAAGVNPLDWMVAEGKARSWIDHPLPLTLGWELSGTVEKSGAGAERFKAGDAVFGMLDLSDNGVWAEYAVADEPDLASKPGRLDFAHAAAVPIGALTAYTALFDAAGLKAGGTVLIHGAAGGVGSMAVQLAKVRGARVIGTATGAEHLALLRELGCDQVLDHEATRFEEEVHGADVVLDPIGADTQRRSFGVLKPGGILVSLTEEPSQDLARERGVRATMIGVKPDGARLKEVAAWIDAGKLRPHVAKVLALDRAKEALELSHTRHVAGKIVLVPKP
jgi:NADPH:quinone reductase-like Zn-dependent oxidoreductase